MHRTMDRATICNIPAPNGEVCMICRFEQTWNGFRWMRQISIHGDVPVVRFTQEHVKSLAIGCPNSEFLASMTNAQLRQSRLHRIEQLTGVVRRPIVNEEQVEIEGKCQ